MKAWFINLDRSPERLAHMNTVLSKLNIMFERIDAVDGRELTKAQMNEVYVRKSNVQQLDRGSIAVFMSQRKAWQAIVASGDRHGIVFEDDILFGRDAVEIFADLSWMPQDINLLRLETVLRHTVHDAKPIMTILNRDIVRMRHVLLGAGAYIISAHAAAHLLEITAKFTYACDYVLFDPSCEDFCGFDVFQMVPAICIQSAVAKKPDLPSILGAMRKEMFYRGRIRFVQKLKREFEKRKLLAVGLFTDRIRDRKTGRIRFE